MIQQLRWLTEFRIASSRRNVHASNMQVGQYVLHNAQVGIGVLREVRFARYLEQYLKQVADQNASDEIKVQVKTFVLSIERGLSTQTEGQSGTKFQREGTCLALRRIPIGVFGRVQLNRMSSRGGECVY
jgi:hypothetical protein